MDVGSRPPHLACPFTGRAVCRCVCGTSVALRDCRAYVLHQTTPDSGDPVVLWLPRLVKREALPREQAEQQRREQAAGGAAADPRQSASDAASAAQQAAAAAAAAVERAEAEARAAAARAAGLAASAGLSYAPPQVLGPDLGAELGGAPQADHSELARQVAAVRAAQEARQAAASAAAARAVAAVPPAAAPPLPMVVPLASLVADTHPASTTQAQAQEAGVVTPGGRLSLRSRSQEPDASLASLPLPSTSVGSGSRAGRRSQQGRTPARTAAASRQGRAGPGKAPRGAGKGAASKQQQQQRRAASRAGGPSGGGAGEAEAGAGDGAAAAPPDLSPFGEGYQPHGPSSATPPSAWLLKIRDFKPALQGRLVQTFWADGGRWWPAVVLRVSVADRSCALFYETGDEEVVEFTQLIQAGEVAWLEGPHAAPGAPASAPRSASSPDGGSGGCRKRAAAAAAAAVAQPGGSTGALSHSTQSTRSSEQDSGERGKRQRVGPQAPLAGQLSHPLPDTAPTPAGSEGSGGHLLLPELPPLSAAHLRGSQAQLVDTSAAAMVVGGPACALEPALSLQQAQQAQVLQAQVLQAQQQAQQPQEQAEQLEARSAEQAPQPAQASQGQPQGRPPEEPAQAEDDAGGSPGQGGSRPAAWEGSEAAPPQQERLPLPMQLPAPLAAAVAQLPPGVQPTRVWELLDLGDAAVGRALLVAALPSGVWQPALVRRCSPRHGLLQVQFSEHAGVLLRAAEEGRAYVLCTSL